MNVAPAIPWGRRLLGAVPGPVFQKEVWMLAKRPSTFWTRLVYTLLLAGVTTLVFIANAPGEDVYSTPAGMLVTSTTQQLQQYQQVAPAVTIGVAWFQFAMLTLIACALCGSAIVEERRAGTLASLLTTPLKPWQIVLGKLLGRVAELGILCLMAAPLLLAVRVFGGVPAMSIVATTALCLSTALAAGQLSLLASVRSKSPTGAIIRGILLTVFFMAVPSLLCTAAAGVLAMGGGGRPSGAMMTILWLAMVLSSPATLGMTSALILSGESAPPGMPSLHLMWIYNVAYMLLITAGAFALSCWSLRRSLARDGAGVVAAVPRRKRKGAAQPATAEGEPIGKRRARRAAPEGVSREVGDAPVLWRELSQRVFERRARNLVALAVLVAGVLFVYWVSAMEEPLHIILSIICLVLCLIIAAVSTTAGISAEREARTLDVLLCGPLAARQIVWGKFWGCLRRQWPGLALIMINLFVGGVLALLWKMPIELVNTVFGVNPGTIDPDEVHWVTLLLMPFIFAPPIAALCGTGILFSAVFRKTTTAAVVNLMTAIAWWLGVPALMAAVVGILDLEHFGVAELGVRCVLALSPPVMTGTMLEGATLNGPAPALLNMDFDLPGPGSMESLGLPAFSATVAVYTLFYLAVTMGAVRLAARVLGRPTGRAH